MPHPIPKSPGFLPFLTEEVGPDYNISYYRPGLYKLVRFNSTAPRRGHLPQEKIDGYKHSQKLGQSLSRAQRMIIEYGLCNEWKWFATLTIDSSKESRTDLALFYDHFTEWLKYQREKTGKKIPYLLVPEKHKKTGWHMHGLFNSDIDDLLISFAELDQGGFRMPSGKVLPRKLIRGNYYDCAAYRKRFGFCSFGKIQNTDATVFYISKYVTKSLLDNTERLGANLYYHSKGLNKAEYLDSVYGRNSFLDAFLTHHYQHCSTGFCSILEELGSDPVVSILEEQKELLFPMDFSKEADPTLEAAVDAYFEVTQLAISGFYSNDNPGAAGPRYKIPEKL